MTILRYKQPRDIKRVFTKFVNKIFLLNEEWINENVEVIAVSDDNSPRAYEQYPWDSEEYPIVVLFSEGSTDDHWAIDSRISDYREYLKIGGVPSTYTTLGVQPVAAGVQPVQSAMTLKSVDLLVKYIGPYEEAIAVKLWSETSDRPGAVLASGSIKGKATTGIEWLHAQIRPEITLVKDAKYFLTAQAPSSSYYWFLDDDADAEITPYIKYGTYDGATWTIDSTQTPVAIVFGPSVRRLGGGLNSGVRLFIEAKDLSTVQKISDLLYIYMHLAKHSNLTRREKLTAPNATAMNFDFVSELTDEGIYIIDVNKGAEAVRTRGNDRLFSIDLTVSCYSNWTEDFSLPTIEDIDADIESVDITLNKYV